MALDFKNTKGSAQKKVDSYEYKMELNTVRLVGGILPRYVYWVKGPGDKNIAIECLAFDREQEKFNRVERDYVPEYFPELKCGWSYAIHCIDPTDGKVKVLNLKKKLFEEIMAAASDLGDPTDPSTGWDVCFTKKKTGPLAFNITYSLQVLKCKTHPLTAEEKAAVEAEGSIDLKYVRPTPEEVKSLLEKICNGGDEVASDAEKEAVNELG